MPEGEGDPFEFLVSLNKTGKLGSGVLCHPITQLLIFSLMLWRAIHIIGSLSGYGLVDGEETDEINTTTALDFHIDAAILLYIPITFFFAAMELGSQDNNNHHKRNSVPPSPASVSRSRSSSEPPAAKEAPAGGDAFRKANSSAGSRQTVAGACAPSESTSAGSQLVAVTANRSQTEYDRICQRVVKRWLKGSMLGAFRRWLEAIIEQQAMRRIVDKVVKRWMRQSLWFGFHKWHSFCIRAYELKFVDQKIRRRQAKLSHKTAFRLWFEGVHWYKIHRRIELKVTRWRLYYTKYSVFVAWANECDGFEKVEKPMEIENVFKKLAVDLESGWKDVTQIFSQLPIPGGAEPLHRSASTPTKAQDAASPARTARTEAIPSTPSTVERDVQSGAGPISALTSPVKLVEGNEAPLNANVLAAKATVKNSDGSSNTVYVF